MEYWLDPRTKQVIRNRLRDELYGNVNRQFNNDVESIIDRNNLLMGCSYDAFSYKGLLYSRAGGVQLKGHPRLHAELHDAMANIISEREKIRTEEEPFVMGYFTKALNRSNSIQDYFFLIPECLHTVLNLFATAEWKASSSWLPRELSDEQIANFKEEHEPWLAKMRYRMMLDLLLN